MWVSVWFINFWFEQFTQCILFYNKLNFLTSAFIKDIHLIMRFTQQQKNHMISNFRMSLLSRRQYYQPFLIIIIYYQTKTPIYFFSVDGNWILDLLSNH